MLLTSFPICADGSDYVAVNSTFVFPAGSPPGFRVFVRVEILNDNIAEANQTFTATLTSETPDVFSVADGGDLTTVTIVDDEGVWGLRIPQFFPVFWMRYK